MRGCYENLRRRQKLCYSARVPPAISLLREKIRARRRALQWTQERAAKEAGVSVTALRDIEQGRTQRSSLGTVLSLCEALDIDLRDDSPDEPPVVARFRESPTGRTLTGPELAHLSAAVRTAPGDVDVSYCYAFVGFMRGFFPAQEIDRQASANRDPDDT